MDLVEPAGMCPAASYAVESAALAALLKYLHGKKEAARTSFEWSRMSFEVVQELSENRCHSGCLLSRQA
jgi:hypothetical protein